MKKRFWFPFLILLIIKVQPFLGRSVLRPIDKKTPKIEIKWTKGNSPSYTLRDSHLEEYPIFKTFNRPFFFKKLLPEGKISYRYEPKKSMDSKILKQLINDVISEIEQKKKTYKDFIVLRKRNFNERKRFGLLILKCKKYPFVVKIFIENPKSFIMHKSKGIVPIFFFYMAGGINRHLLGFTRIKNLEKMQKKLSESSRWANSVTMPRKWFMLPEKNRWIKISGTNIGNKKKQEVEIPGIYCVISDWIDSQRATSMFNRKDRQTCMKLCNYLELAIDPHIDNFMIERNTKKIAIVDTEHFLSVVGMRKKKKFTGYFSWGIHLSGLAFNAMFLRTKKDRKLIQLKRWETELTYNEPTDKSLFPCS